MRRRVAALRHRKRCSRIRDAAQHTGDVAQWRRLLAAFGERTRGLSLEIDDLEFAGARAKHLPQVVVAVRARAKAEVVADIVSDLVDPTDEMIASFDERLRFRDPVLR